MNIGQIKVILRFIVSGFLDRLVSCTPYKGSNIHVPPNSKGIGSNAIFYEFEFVLYDLCLHLMVFYIHFNIVH